MGRAEGYPTVPEHGLFTYFNWESGKFSCICSYNEITYGSICVLLLHGCHESCVINCFFLYAFLRYRRKHRKRTKIVLPIPQSTNVSASIQPAEKINDSLVENNNNNAPNMPLVQEPPSVSTFFSVKLLSLVEGDRAFPKIDCIENSKRNLLFGV